MSFACGVVKWRWDVGRTPPATSMAGLLGRTGRQATSTLARLGRTPGAPRAYATGKPQVLLMDEISLARKDLERLEANTEVLVCTSQMSSGSDRAA